MTGMGGVEDLTVEILKQIRDEIRKTNERLGTVEGRLGSLEAALGSRIDQTNHRLSMLEERQTATEMRLATELFAVVGAIHELRDTSSRRSMSRRS
jgi:hypothetical protein